MAGIVPILEPDPTAGQVVVTRFECGTYRALLAVLLLHFRLKLDVRRQATGFVGIRLHIDWRRRVVLSISLWNDLESIYTMGEVGRHVAATRLPGRLGVNTACGVFCFVGDWRRVMFRAPRDPRTPLRPLRETAGEESQGDREQADSQREET